MSSLRIMGDQPQILESCNDITFILDALAGQDFPTVKCD